MDLQTANAVPARRSQPVKLVQLTEALEAPGFAMAFARNEEIFGEEEPADFVYRVISGVVRTCRVLSDGRRQISGFHLPGDVFGLEMGEVHRRTAEAVSDVEIALVRRSALHAAARRESCAARELWTLTACNLERAERHLMLLGRKSALERVACFLLDLAERAGAKASVDLAMCRTDMADYLGLTIETVSRSLSQLERDQLIELAGSRQIRFRRPSALRAVAGEEQLREAA
jgi:CRP/FNR family nitrogen fixation transcriptional regulator